MLRNLISLNAGPSSQHEADLAIFDRAKKIPKIIHQTNYPRPWPSIVDEGVSNLININSEWDYHFYSEQDHSDFIEKNYGKKLLSYYQKIDPEYGAARADFFRYLLMYRKGGVYLDIKSGTSRPLSESIDLDWGYVLSTWPNKQGGQYDHYGIHDELTKVGLEEFQQWFIICAPGHPFLRAVILSVMSNIDKYNPFAHGTARKAVINTTGPIAYTIAIAKVLDKEQHVFKKMSDLGIYYSIYDEKGFGNLGHVSSSHYSALSGRPVIKQGMIMNSTYKAVRKASRI